MQPQMLPRRATAIRVRKNFGLAAIMGYCQRLQILQFNRNSDFNDSGMRGAGLLSAGTDVQLAARRCLIV